VIVHASRPPVGLVEVTALPTSSTATHNETDGHDTPVSAFRGLKGVLMVCHAVNPCELTDTESTRHGPSDA
jgi:hypothetical protein